MNLTLVIFILPLNLSQFIVTVLFDLFDDHAIPVDQLLVVLLLFVDLGLFVLHLLPMLFLFIQDFILVVHFDLLDSCEEVLMLSFLLSLKL